MTLEGKDTPSKVAFLCRKAMQPADPRYDVPACAAVCVYPKSGPRRETVSRRFKSQGRICRDRFSDGAHAAEIKAGRSP
jgi:deoxyribose-phosphate aldolase